MVCTGCDGYIDTDFDVTGVWEDKGTRFWCGKCLETAIEEKKADCPILANYKIQDPSEYYDTFPDEDDREPVHDDDRPGARAPAPVGDVVPPGETPRPPYPEFCHHPERCHNRCSRDPICID